MNKDELKALLDKYDNAYYNNDNPEISDVEYDSLKKKYLLSMDKDEYDCVPGKALFNKVKHKQPMLSLDKIEINESDKLEKAINDLWPIVIQDKFDGLTIVMNNGQAVTRGNGIVGEDVTANALKMNGIGKNIGFPIRGEAIIKHSDFERINKTKKDNNEKLLKNCRNGAAGMLRNKNNLKVDGLTFYAYNIIFNKENNNNEEQIKLLKENGWNIANTFIPKTREEAYDYIINYNREKLDYDIDGLVIKHNGNKAFGYTQHHPKGAMAIKFVSEQNWSILRRIKWNTGRTGKVVPTGYYDPIELCGTTNQKATLNNIAYIHALNLELNLPILVSKSHDVIPVIVDCKNSNLGSTINAPTECPECGSTLEKVNDQLFCRNNNCNSRLINRIIHIASRDALDIDTLGEENAEKIFNKYKDFLNNNPAKIFELTESMIKELDGFADVSASKLYNAIQKSKKATLDKFLYAVGIPLLGKKAATDIAYTVKDIENFAEDVDNNFTLIKTIDGIGDKIIKSIKENLFMIIELASYIEILPIKKEKHKAANQLTFVITGEFNVSRKDIKNKIEKTGHKVTGSVSKKTNYVIVGEKPGSKYDKAKSLGVKTINSLEELNNILEI